MSKIKKSRAYIFTFNNYTEDDERRIQSIICKYLIYGREVGEQCGTPHLQGYIYFLNARAKRGVERAIGGDEQRLYVRVPDGNSLDQYDYNSKQDASFFEKGERPLTPEEAGQVEKDRWTAARKAAMEGRMDDIPADLYTRFQSSYKRMRREDGPKPQDLPYGQHYGVWIWGGTRTGKSHDARHNYGDVYLKDINKWWDGYEGQDNVLIEEFSPEHSKYMTSFMKKWVDRWRFSAETKGSHTIIRPKKIIVTSNYSLEECFQGVDLEAMKQRFEVIHKTKQYNAGKIQACFEQVASGTRKEANSSDCQDGEKGAPDEAKEDC